MSEKAKIYFPGLNGLRFFSAFAVIVHHIEFMKYHLGAPSLWENPFFHHTGDFGVSFFFVLSGFLITYLLLAEKTQTGNVAIRKFYLRRLLRIWPLYYLIFGLSYWLMPWLAENASANNLGYAPGEWGYFVFFLPNIAMLLYSSMHFGLHLWSIGVEEQFYALWPWLAKTGKHIIWFALGLFVVFAALKWGTYGSPKGSLTLKIHQFLYISRFDCMAAGAIVAWLLFYKKNNILNIAFSVYAQLFVWGILLMMIISGIDFSFMTQQVYSVLFALIILNTGANPRRLIGFEGPLLNYLGKISYGIYMFHPLLIGIVLMLTIMNPAFPLTGLGSEIILYFTVIALTIAFSSLSYHVYEKPFLRLKNRFRRLGPGKKAT